MTVQKVLSATTLVVGLVLFVLGFVVQFAVFPQVLRSQVFENLKLEEGTEAWDGFVEPPVPVYMQFRFFNVTNPERIKEGETPIVKEVGPYVYVETRRKEDIFAVGNDQINYAQYYAYSFDEAKTEEFGCNGCKDTDEIVVINPFMLIIAQLMPDIKAQFGTVRDVAKVLNVTEDQVIDLLVEALSQVPNLPFPAETLAPSLTTLVFNLELSKIEEFVDQSFVDRMEDIVVLTSPDQLLYSGFEPTIIDGLLRSVNFLIKGILEALNLSDVIDLPEELVNAKLEELKDQLCPTLPEPLADCKFGLFKGGNGTKGTTTGSYYTINSGRHDMHKFLNIEKFRGSETLPDEWWPFIAPTPSAQEAGVPGVCHDIYGSDGTMFPPFVEKEESKWLFVSELCRSIWLDFDTEVEVEDIEAYRYRPPIDVFKMTNPNNYCYCPEFESCAFAEEDKDVWNATDCYDYCKDGFIKVGQCYGGLPLIMSAPHYWNVDENLSSQIIGLEADRDKHDTYLDIEPITGVALSAHKRIQINFGMNSYEGFDVTKNLPKVELFPVLWADEGADLDTTNADKFKDAIVKPTNIVLGLSIALGMVLGAVLVVVGIICLRRRRSQAYQEPVRISSVTKTH